MSRVELWSPCSYSRSMPRRPSEAKRRKPPAERKEELIRVRVTPDQKKQLGEAASRAGLDVSSWLRTLGIGLATGAAVGALAAILGSQETSKPK